MIEDIKTLSGWASFIALNSSSHTSSVRSEINSKFSKPIISPLGVFNFPYRGATFITGVSVKLTVFAETPPQPLSNAFIIVFEFVLGGPDPITNGLGNLMPFTSMLKSAINFSLY